MKDFARKQLDSHRTNLKKFASVRKPSDLKGAPVKASKRKDTDFRRMPDITKERGKSMEELLKYDVCSSSRLFDEEGLTISATKSDIVQELEKQLSSSSPREVPYDDSMKTGYIADVGKFPQTEYKEHERFWRALR